MSRRPGASGVLADWLADSLARSRVVSRALTTLQRDVLIVLPRAFFVLNRSGGCYLSVHSCFSPLFCGMLAYLRWFGNRCEDDM